LSAPTKTSIQARKATGGMQPACPGHVLHIGDRYQRHGAVQRFAGLLVHRGATLARCFERKRFAEFQAFLRMLFASLWCKRIRVLHLILDNASTHAPKQLAGWIRALGLRFAVRLHWLPVHASWLDQIEIIFSVLQRKVLTPNDFASPTQVERRMLTFLAESVAMRISGHKTNSVYRRYRIVDEQDIEHALVSTEAAVKQAPLGMVKTLRG
jgi:hypothetical protein